MLSRQQAQKSTDCSMVVSGKEGGTGFGEILGNASAIIKRRLGVATGSHIVPATQQRMEETFCHGDRYGSLIHRGNGDRKVEGFPCAICGWCFVEMSGRTGRGMWLGSVAARPRQRRKSLGVLSMETMLAELEVQRTINRAEL